ncbi:hypothetical protein BGZ47_002622 [Haplosporangium gracile]|nr:hypothetical protein BGZ47_002622 [Haplosporangium gracile]
MGAPSLLFFSTYSDRSSRSSKTLKSSASSRSVTSTSSSKSFEGSSNTCVDFEDLDCSNLWSTKIVFLPVTGVSLLRHDLHVPYAMKNFEPECLPRSGYQRPASVLVGAFGTLSTCPHIHPSPMLFSEYMYLIPGLEDPIIDFAEYADFDDQENVEVEVEDKCGDKTAGSSETSARVLNLAVDTVAASAAVVSCSPFPMDTMIPLSLLSPTTATARAMESMNLSSLVSSDNDVKCDKGTECL